jgi:hypothetical protein
MQASDANRLLILAVLAYLVSAPLLAQTSANTEWRIPRYSSYVELDNGAVFCGEFTSYHESRKGKVCAGGQYASYYEGATGEVACGGQYACFHEDAPPSQ